MMELTNTIGLVEGEKPSTRTETAGGITIYSVPVSILLGLQGLVASLIIIIYLPIIMFSSFCLLPDDEARGFIISKILVVSGIATLFQTLLGVRFPLLIAPSLIVMSSVTDNFKTIYWESFTDGDLFAMGPAVRYSEYVVRTTEIQGLLIITSLCSSVIFGFSWYFRLKLPPSTIAATLLTNCIFNILTLLPQKLNTDDLELQKTTLSQLTLSSLMLLFIVQNLKIPFLKIITNQDYKIMLRIFKLFPVLITFISLLFVNVKFEMDKEEIIERAIKKHSWMSLNFISADFNIPSLSWRATLFIPSFLAQIIGSYCWYSLVTKGLGRLSLAVLCECTVNVLASLFGILFPMAIDPVSIGLWSLTEIKNTETSAITGSLLVVFSAFLPVVSLLSVVPFSVLFGICVYLYGKLICQVLSDFQEDLKMNLNVIVLSLVFGMGFSFLTPGFGENYYFNLLIAFLKNPILLTFVFSLILRVPYSIPAFQE